MRGGTAFVEVAYEHWTKFDEFPHLMHRVLNVKREGRDKVVWDEKIWFSRRHWEGKITNRRKNDRIAWKSTEGMSHSGVVSFHRIGDRLTRVMVTVDFVPQGVVEKVASGLRFVKRAVQADLACFKAYVEMEDARGLEYGWGADGSEEDGDQESSGEDRESSRQERQDRRKSRRSSS